MITLTSLPAEILTEILRYVNVNGDLAQLRLVSTQMNTFMGEEQHRYLHDIRSRYAISERVMQLYHDSHGTSEGAAELCYYLFFRREVAMFQALDSHLPRASSATQASGLRESPISSFLLLSAMARKYKNMEQCQVAQAGTIHNMTLEDCSAIVGSLRYYLGTNWELEEIEVVISATSRCASALWCLDPSNKPIEPFKNFHEPRLQGCCVHFGGCDNRQEAILTEHLLTNGPAWAARILLSQAVLQQHDWSPRARSLQLRSFDAIWRIAPQHGARQAASGVARMLWRLRPSKLEEEQQRRQREKLEALKIQDMRVSAGVWRGSAGDI